MSIILRIDRLSPELLSLAYAAACAAPTEKELELARDRVKQVKGRRYRLLPVSIHRANAIMDAKGKAAYDLYLQEDAARFEDQRTQDLEEALTALAVVELRLERSTTEGILLHALELGLRQLATDA